jgi:hypothetical protein
MDNFYSNIPADQAQEIEQCARLMYELRGARDTLLAQLGAADAPQALDCIVGGEMPEHPSYEQYLSARILDTLHAEVRADLAERVKIANQV